MSNSWSISFHLYDISFVFKQNYLHYEISRFMHVNLWLGTRLSRFNYINVQPRLYFQIVLDLYHLVFVLVRSIWIIQSSIKAVKAAYESNVSLLHCCINNKKKSGFKPTFDYILCFTFHEGTKYTDKVCCCLLVSHEWFIEW